MRRALGDTDIRVHPVGLGGMPLSIDGRPDERTARAVIAEFLERGGDFIDTAISYCLDDRDFGHNERLIAGVLRELGRSDVIVATKGGLRRPGGRWEVDASPAFLRRSCEESLVNLGEPIALYYLHAVDDTVPLEDSVGELARLQQEGKIRYIGISNVDEAELDRALRIAPIAAVQNRCNILEREDLTSGLVERCRREKIAYVPYSPAGGHRGHRRLAAHASLARLAAKHGITPQSIAIAWLLEQGEHVLPIPGASRVESVRASLAATEIALDAEDRATLGRL
jgi:aryl-alcohol dehydrogenase-like predicted oxidoreductase